jgi:dTDP-4-amino-4,6-dideoxygalactose transaminase
MSVRPTDQNPYDPVTSMKHAYKRPSSLFFRLFMVQSKRFNTLHSKRQQNAKQLAEELSKLNLSSVYAEAPYGITSAWDKFFCIIPKSDIVQVARKLNASGIEARHLENRYGSLRQPRLDELPSYAENTGLDRCMNYFDVHDAVLHLPLHEKMRPGDFRKIAETLNVILDEKSID